MSGDTWTCAHDTLGHLRAVRPPGTSPVEYILDGASRRVVKRVAGVPVQGFIYRDQWRPLAELDGAGHLLSRFVYATRPNVPDYMIRGGVLYRILSDLVGSVRLVIDATSGVIAQRLDYDAFGKVVADTNPGFQPFGFAGGLYDPQTGLTRFGAREYDAADGRFTTKDPVAFSGGETNLYTYARNDPVNFVDPRGLDASLLQELYNAWARQKGRAPLGDTTIPPDDLESECGDELDDLADDSLVCRAIVNLIRDHFGMERVDAASEVTDVLEEEDYDDLFDANGCPRPDAGERVKERRRQRKEDARKCWALLGGPG